jgi:hypothetical protein
VLFIDSFLSFFLLPDLRAPTINRSSRWRNKSVMGGSQRLRLRMVGRRSIVNLGAVLAMVDDLQDLGDREVLSNPRSTIWRRRRQQKYDLGWRNNHNK